MDENSLYKIIKNKYKKGLKLHTVKTNLAPLFLVYNVLA